jgi:hypothetical protein
VFNHRTNINIANRIVSFDIKELGKQIKKIGMLIVQDAVWNRVNVSCKEAIEAAIREHYRDNRLDAGAAVGQVCVSF